MQLTHWTLLTETSNAFWPAETSIKISGVARGDVHPCAAQAPSKDCRHSPAAWQCNTARSKENASKSPLIAVQMWDFVAVSCIRPYPVGCNSKGCKSITALQRCMRVASNTGHDRSCIASILHDDVITVRPKSGTAIEHTVATVNWLDAIRAELPACILHQPYGMCRQACTACTTLAPDPIVGCRGQQKAASWAAS